MTVLSVYCRIGGTNFGDCVRSDCVAFSKVLLSVGKIWILVLDFLSKIASAEITVDRFVDIAIDLVESLRKSSQVQQGGLAGGGARVGAGARSYRHHHWRPSQYCLPPFGISFDKSIADGPSVSGSCFFQGKKAPISSS